MDLLTVRETAMLLRVSQVTVRRYGASGQAAGRPSWPQRPDRAGDGYLVSRMGRDGAFTVLRDMDAGMVAIRISSDDEQAGRVILDHYADKDFSLTDAISFAVMDRLKLRTAFAIDRHLAQSGLDILTAE